jgi:hypothetical protein
MRASRRAALATPREIPSAGHAKSANFAIVSWDPYDARKTAKRQPTACGLASAISI